MPTLKERLIRIGFCETDVERAINAVGPDAHIDEAAQWIALAQIKRIFSAAGMREIDKTGHWIALAQIKQAFGAAEMCEHVRMEDET